MRILYENYVDTATITASESNSFYPVSNLQKLSTTDAWRSNNATGTKTIVFDLGSAKTVDTCVVVGDNYNRVLTATTLLIEGNATDSWGSPSFSQSLVISANEAIASALFTDKSYRYWRISATHTGSYISFSKVFLANQFTYSDNGFDINFNFALSDLSKIRKNDIGKRFIDEIRNTVKSLSLSINTMNKTELDSFIAFVRYVGLHKPFVLFVDENQNIVTDKHLLTLYAMFDSVGSIDSSNLGYYNSTFNLSEVV
jgi:hypothetical protein